MDSIEPTSDSEDVDHVEEVGSMFFETCCKPSHILHAAEEPFDNIAHGVERFVMRDRISGIGFGRDDGQRGLVCDLLSDFGAPVSLVGHNSQRRFPPVQKQMHHPTVMDVSSGNPQS